MASDDEGFGEHWKQLIAGRNSHEHPLSPECVRSLCDVIDLAPVTASSIRKTFTSRLDLWLNPILDAATAANDFDLRDLRKSPMSIYVGVNPDDLHRLRPVLNLFFQQAIGLQTRELPERNPALKHQVMMLLDEFTALGRIPIIAEAISYIPGYNVRVVLVIQTPAQLREVYGIHNSEVMLKSLAARIVFAPKDFSDARERLGRVQTEEIELTPVSPPPPRWTGTLSITPAQQLNEQCVELVCEIASGPSPLQLPPFLCLNRDLWCRLDAAARKRVAALPFVIVDLRFRDNDWWRDIIERLSMAPTDPTPFTDLALETLLFARQAAREDITVAKTMFAMTAAVAHVIASLTMLQVRSARS